jgi:methionyl-tRNA formyltransferase
VINGDRLTGVSIMRIVRELDAGPVFAARTHAIGPDDTSIDVERDLAALGADLLLDVIGSMSRGKAVETPQDDERATYAPKLTKEDGRLDWNEPAERIHDRVRGLHPWPYAYSFLNGTRFVIRRTTVDVERSLFRGTAAAQPGAILHAHRSDLIVAAGGGSALRILEIQPENKRVMSAEAFLAGHAVQASDRFEEVASARPS